MTTATPWLEAAWRFVRGQLPAPPATVLEIGCGRHGGFVPALLDAGHNTTGVDPAAPEGPEYEQATFEELAAPGPFDVVVACTSLHHVVDVGAVVDRIAAILAPGGTVVVVEWAWERFDEATARWCFERLAPTPPADEPSWLHRHRDGWAESGRSWDRYFSGWVSEHGLHAAGRIVDALDTRFERGLLGEAPYFFSDLVDTSEADEQAAIDARTIQATGLCYVGRGRRQ